MRASVAAATRVNDSPLTLFTQTSHYYCFLDKSCFGLTVPRALSRDDRDGIVMFWVKSPEAFGDMGGGFLGTLISPPT
jgi:hypothetical protein